MTNVELAVLQIFAEILSFLLVSVCFRGGTKSFIVHWNKVPPRLLNKLGKWLHEADFVFEVSQIFLSSIVGGKAGARLASETNWTNWKLHIKTNHWTHCKMKKEIVFSGGKNIHWLLRSVKYWIWFDQKIEGQSIRQVFYDIFTFCGGINSENLIWVTNKM